jgi:hypothetical protein
MRWTGHIVQTGKIRNAYTMFVAGRNHVADLVVDGKIILK